VLEAIGDPRAMAVAARALDEGGEVAVAATSTLRVLLGVREESVAAEALDRIVQVALNRSCERRVRLAAFEALRDVPGGVRDRVMQALAVDADPVVQAHVAGQPRDAAALDAVWQDALSGVLPDDPAELREAARARTGTAALGELRSLIDAIRAREGTATPGSRADWRGVRGALHQALALRGSRVAVYDLRETLADASGPLPASFVAALHGVGDETCLEPIAAACTRATDARWQHQLAEAFRAIARRERIGARSAAMKKIMAKWPMAAALAGKTGDLHGRQPR
jgi:hypothetical protein